MHTRLCTHQRTERDTAQSRARARKHAYEVTNTLYHHQNDNITNARARSERRANETRVCAPWQSSRRQFGFWSRARRNGHLDKNVRTHARVLYTHGRHTRTRVFTSFSSSEILHHSFCTKVSVLLCVCVRVSSEATQQPPPFISTIDRRSAPVFRNRVSDRLSDVRKSIVACARVCANRQRATQPYYTIHNTHNADTPT